MEKHKAVAYARYSSENQRVESVITQLQIIRKYCSENNFDLVHEYHDEAMSGTNDRRTDFQRMIVEAKSNLFDTIIVYKFDRFSRNVNDHFKYREILDRMGIRLISVIENYDEETPEGNFFSLIQLGMSEFYVRNLKREVLRGLLSNARKCIHTGGLPPLGYKVTKDTLEYTIDECQAESVRIIFQMYSEGYSYRDIANKLNGMGKLSNIGKPFRPFFFDILNNRKYIGEYVYNRSPKLTNYGNRNHRKNKEEHEIIRIKGGIPQIIDEGLFNKVTLLRSQNKQNNKAKRKYILSGILRCCCGSSMSGAARHGGRNATLQKTYKCNSRKVAQSTCNVKELKMERIETYAEKTLREYLKIKNIDSTTKIINAEIEKINKTVNDDISEEIQDNEKNILSLNKLLITADKELVMNITNELNTRIAKQSVLIEDLKGKPLKKLSTIKPDDIRQSILAAQDILKKNDRASLRQVLLNFIRVIKVNNESITITLNLNTFFNNELREEISHDIIEDRDFIILGKRSNNNNEINNVQIND